MKNKVYYLIGFLILLVFGGCVFVQHLVKKEHEQMVNLCTNTTDEDLIFKCNYGLSMNYQAKYDMFYKNRQFYDRTFALYFKNAETDCLNYSNQCIVRDKFAADNILKKCASTGEYDCLKFIQPQVNDNNIEIFDKSISKNYQEINKNDNIIHNNPCSGEQYNFFTQLTDEQKNKLSTKTLNICNAQGDFYKQHPDMAGK